MTSMTKTFKALTLVSLLSLGGTSMALAADALTVNLTANKVVTANGKTSLQSVGRASSGDVIQYTATYRNTIEKAMTDVNIDIPVPANMVYSGTSSPAPTQASLDGKKFENIPLKRQVNGKMVEVPQSEYRAVRWQVKHLPAKKEASVSMNVKVR